MKNAILFALIFQVAVSTTHASSLFKQSAAANTPNNDYDPTKVVQAEVYLDNAQIVERDESSPGSPPMATDDPGTPGKNGFEISLISNCDYSSGSRACDTGIDLPIGIGDTVQLRFSKSITTQDDSGQPSQHGYGATDIGVKWRFFDRNGLQIAVFPSFKLNDATRQTNPDGTQVEPEGRSVYLPIIVSKDIGDKYTVVGNIAYRANLDYSNKSTVFTSVALGRSLSPTSRAMVEVASEGNSEGRRTDVRIGWVKVLFPNSSGKYRTSFFTSVGRSVGPTDDGKPHTTLLVGLTVTKKGD